MSDEDNEDIMMSDESDASFEYEESDDEMAVSETENGVSNATNSNSFDNQYYSAKVVGEDDKKKARDMFEAIIAAVVNSGDSDAVNGSVWEFKSRKQLMKILKVSGEDEELLSQFKKVLQMGSRLDDSVYFSGSLNRLIEKYGGKVSKFIEVALEHQNLLSKEQVVKLHFQKLKELASDGVNISGKKSDIDKLVEFITSECTNEDYVQRQILLETYSIELRMLFSSSDMMSFSKMSQIRGLVANCKVVEDNLAHPRILGVIYEAEGKLKMVKKQYDEAVQKLLESFKNYDDSGLGVDKTRTLKSLVLLDMLTLKSDINILGSNDIRPYLDSSTDSDIQMLLSLRKSYESSDSNMFFSRLQSLDNQLKTSNDRVFLSSFHHELANSLRKKVLYEYCRVFSEVETSFLCKELNLEDSNDLEELIFAMTISGGLPYKMSFDYEADKIVIGEREEFVGAVKDDTSKLNNSEISSILRTVPKVTEEILTQAEKVELEKNWVVKSEGDYSFDTVQESDKLSRLIIENSQRCNKEREGKSKKQETRESVVSMMGKMESIILRMEGTMMEKGIY